MCMTVGGLRKTAVQFNRDRVVFGDMTLFFVCEDGESFHVVIVGDDDITCVFLCVIEDFSQSQASRAEEWIGTNASGIDDAVTECEEFLACVIEQNIHAIVFL